MRDYQKRFHEGSVAPAFKLGGDGRPMREGAELAPHFFSSRGSAAQDIASLKGVANQATQDSLLSYATTGLMSKQDAAGMLRPEEMKKWLAKHSQALDALATPQQRWTLDAARQSASTSNRSLTFNKALGSNTEQNQAAREMLGPGWIDHPLTKWLAGKLPAGDFARKSLSKGLTTDKAERIGDLLANPDKLAEAVAAYRTVAGRAAFGTGGKAAKQGGAPRPNTPLMDFLPRPGAAPRTAWARPTAPRRNPWPFITDITKLSQTPELNGPDGSVDPPSTLDDQDRYLGSFIAKLRDGVGFSAGAAVGCSGLYACPSKGVAHPAGPRPTPFHLWVRNATLGKSLGLRRGQQSIREPLAD